MSNKGWLSAVTGGLLGRAKTLPADSEQQTIRKSIRLDRTTAEAASEPARRKTRFAPSSLLSGKYSTKAPVSARNGATGPADQPSSAARDEATPTAASRQLTSATQLRAESRKNDNESWDPKLIMQSDALKAEIKVQLAQGDKKAARRVADAYSRLAPHSLNGMRSALSVFQKTAHWGAIINYAEQSRIAWRSDVDMLKIVSAAYSRLKKYDDSYALILKALELRRDAGTVLSAAQLLMRLSKSSEALPFWREYVGMRPQERVGKIGLINAFVGSGHLAEAMAAVQAELTLEPDNSELHLLSASIKTAGGDNMSAYADILKAIESSPNNAAGVFQLLRLVPTLNDDDALDQTARIAKDFLANENHEKIAGLAVRLFALIEDPERGIPEVNSIVQTYVTSRGVLTKAAAAFVHLGALERARDALQQLLLLDKHPPNAVYDLAGILCQLSLPQKAVELLRSYFNAEQRDVSYHVRLGHILAWSGSHLEAQVELQEALALEPDNFQALSDLSFTYERENELGVSYCLLLKAIAASATTLRRPSTTIGLSETNPTRLHRRLVFASDVLGHREQAKLLSHEFARRQPLSLPFSIKLWQGESVDDAHIMAIAEGGVGDELRFTSIYKRFFRSASRVSITCDPRLQSILNRSFPTFDFYPSQRVFQRFRTRRSGSTRVALNAYTRNLVSDEAIAAGEHADCWVSMLHAFDLDMIEHVEAPQGSRGATIKVDKVRKLNYGAEIRRRAEGRKIIGLSWRGGHTSYNRNGHYFSVRTMQALLNDENLAFVNLQYCCEDEELEYLRDTLGSRLIEFPDLDLKDDFEGVGALCSVLDTTVAVCTSVLELAAAVGCTSIYMMRDPLFTHRVRLLGRADRLGTFQDRVWACCRILPKWSGSDEEYFSQIRRAVRAIAEPKRSSSMSR